ncbi:MAG: hypothetical protein ABI602_03950 [Candidatus Saccharibacteria bacterium]
MAAPEQIPQFETYTDDERLMLWRVELQRRLGDCSQRLSNVSQEWHGLLEQVLACDLEIRERGVDRSNFYERPMPESLGGPEAPILTIVDN